MCASIRQNFQNKMFQFYIYVYDILLIQLVYMAGQITVVSSNKWPKVINPFAQRLEWHH